MTPESARLWTDLTADIGALVVGRKLFDVTKGWGGNHPLGVPVVVLTHNVPDDWPHADAPFTFVTDGIEGAIARARQIAGGRNVSVAAGTLAGQALDAGLLDEIWVMLAPVVLGEGTPFFARLRQAPVVLTGPEVTESAGVTHLRYTVKR
jgi:dihydrofolate reductase